MFALLLALSCSSTPPSTWTPLPPPLPSTPGAYEELLLVLESLMEADDSLRSEMREQVRAGVVPEDVVLEHRDLSVLLAADGYKLPVFGLEEEAPYYMALLVLADAAVLEARVHLAYGEGGYAWGALEPALKIAGDLQGGGGGTMPFMVGTAMEQLMLEELEAILATPYGLGREGEQALRTFLLARQARPVLAPYAVSTECESVALVLEGPGDLGMGSLLYDPEETLALFFDFCGARLAMMGKPYREWEEPEPVLPSRLGNRVGQEMLSVLTFSPLRSGRGEMDLQVQRAVLLTAVDLRAGYDESWPEQGMPTDPSTGKTLLWDGKTLLGGVAVQDVELFLTPAPPVWNEAP
jgi:hypothetical protein